jgi:hypothetical protein
MRISRNKIIFLAIIMAVLLGLTMFLRSPYVSNVLKKAVLEKIHIATGHQVIAGQMYVNIFPAFVGFSDIKAFDSEGTRIFAAEKIKAYLSFTRIFIGEISIGRIVLTESGFWATDRKVEKLLKHLKQRKPERKKGFLSIDVRNIVLEDSDISYFHEKSETMVSAVNADMVLRIYMEPKAEFSIENLDVFVKDLPTLGGR